MVAADQKPDIKQAVIVMAEGFLEAEVVMETRKEEVYPQPAATASEDGYGVHALLYTSELGGSMSSGPKHTSQPVADAGTSCCQSLRFEVRHCPICLSPNGQDVSAHQASTAATDARRPHICLALGQSEPLEQCCLPPPF